jgi:hypothetical protein
VPELRRHFFYRRAFLNRRSAALDAGLVGALAALILRSPFPLLAGTPYGRMVLGAARGSRRVAAVQVAADLVGFLSLLQGTLRYRSPLL